MHGKHPTNWLQPGHAPHSVASSQHKLQVSCTGAGGVGGEVDAVTGAGVGAVVDGDGGAAATDASTRLDSLATEVVKSSLVAFLSHWA